MYICHDASVVHASCSDELLANPPVTGTRLSPRKLTRRAVTWMEIIDLVVGEDHILGQSCQRYDLLTGRRSSIASGSLPRRKKTQISIPICPAEISACEKDFRR